MSTAFSAQMVSHMVSHQWATRPDDECFPDLPAFLTHLQHRTDHCRVVQRDAAALRVDAAPTGDVQLVSERGNARLTHHSFGQLATFAGLSGRALRDAVARFQDKPAAGRWVAEGLNWGLQAKVGREDEAQAAQILLQLPNGEPTPLIRGLTTPAYARMWDVEVVRRICLPLQEAGFSVPVAMDGKAALFASDRDFFFLMAPKGVSRINMPGVTDTDGGFGGFEVRGQLFFPFLIGTGSEVGGQSQVFHSGLLQAICGNLILWGVRDMVTINLRHVGKIEDRIRGSFQDFLVNWVQAGTYAERQMLEAAMEFHVAQDAAGAITFLREKGFTKALAEQTVQVVEAGDPTTGVISQDPTMLFNAVAAATSIARTIAHQDAKLEAERQASSLLKLAAAKV